MRPRISIRGCVRLSIRPLVRQKRFCKKWQKRIVIVINYSKTALKVTMKVLSLPRRSESPVNSSGRRGRIVVPKGYLFSVLSFAAHFGRVPRTTTYKSVGLWVCRSIRRIFYCSSNTAHLFSSTWTNIVFPFLMSKFWTSPGCVLPLTKLIG